MATPAWRHANPAAGTNVTSLPVAIPSGVQGAVDGDYGLLVCAVAPATVPDPADWTPVPNFPTGVTTSQGRFYLWERTLTTAVLGSNVTLAPASSSRIVAACAAVAPAVRDALAINPVNTSGAQVTASEADPAVADALLVCIFGVLSNTNGEQPGWTPPEGMIERIDVSSASASTRNAALHIATQVLASSDPTGVRIATADKNVQRQAITIALRSTAAVTVAQAEVAEFGVEAVFDPSGGSTSLDLVGVNAIGMTALALDSTTGVPAQDDEFNATTVSARWTEVDPAGDCTIEPTP